MVYEFEVDGEQYELNGNPSLGTVREVQSMQTDLLLDYLDEEDLKSMDSLEDESEIVQAIIDEGGVEAFEEVQWRRSLLEPRQTISLAADYAFDSDEFDDLSANSFKEVRKEAEEVLDGDASDFFDGLGVGMSLSQERET